MTAGTCSSPAVVDLLIEAIRRDGPIPFARFMDIALYAPGTGYYEAGPGRVGRDGDYHTSVSVGRMFGRRLASRFAGGLARLPGDRFQLVEAGAHDGRLAADLLEALRDTHPGVAGRLEYVIMEPSERRRAWQARTLSAHASQVRWVSSLDAFGESGVTGVIFGNEFLDALPVHRLGWDPYGGRWFEWHVAEGPEGFVWHRPGSRRRTPELPPVVEQALAIEYGHVLSGELLSWLPEDFSLEVHPAALAWWRQAAASLRAGWMVAVDYGAEEGEEVQPGRMTGTLRAFGRHRAFAEVLQRPGSQDITADVPFRGLRTTGEEAGLETECWISQAAFLVHGLEGDRTVDDWTPADRRQFATLIHPQHFGERFRVLVQRRLPGGHPAGRVEKPPPPAG